MFRFHSGTHGGNAGSSFEQLLTDRDVARITGMSLAWVRRQRLVNGGPPYRRLGGCIRYDPAELRGWLASRPAGGERSPEGTR